MPNKNSKNRIINAELTDCQWDKNLIGQKFSAFVEMIIEKKSNQVLAKQPRNNKVDNKTTKQPAWFAAFAKDFNQWKLKIEQEIVEIKQQIQTTNQKVDQFKQEVKQEIAEIKQEIAEIKQEMREFKQEVNYRLDKLEQRIDNLVVKNKLVE